MLNTLFVVVLADLWKLHRHPVYPLAAVMLCAKLAVEITAGQSLVVSTAWPAVPLAHLAGVVGGAGLLWGRRGGPKGA